MELFCDNKTNVFKYILVTRLKWSHVREFGFRNPGNVCLWNPESGQILLSEYKKKKTEVLGFGMGNTGQGIRNPSYTDKYRNPVPAILVKNLETLVCVFPSPKLIWVLQWFHCFKICVAQHWGGRGHITARTKVWGVNLKNFLENSREVVSVSTICDEYCGIQNSRLSWISLHGGSKTSRYSD